MDAPLDLIKEMGKSQFLLLLLEEGMYMDKMVEIAKSMEKTEQKICYLCLSKPYIDVYNDLKNRSIYVEKFHFIDVLTSHYEKKESTSNCTFLDSPTNLNEIRSALSNVIKEKDCSVVVVDTISTMLIYQQSSDIVRFTHEFLTEERERNKILYLVLKDDTIPLEENDKLVKDLSMFADNTIDLEARS